MIEELLFELVQVSLGIRDRLTHTPNVDEWKQLYEIAKEQTLIGICFAGVQQLCNPENSDYCGMNEMQYLTWMGMTAIIQHRNNVLNKQCKELQANLAANHFHSCILKGQSVAQLYSQSLRNLRQSGDIDVWVDASLKDIKKWIERIHPLDHCDYMHTPVQLFPDTVVELHFRPWVSHNLIRNHRLQKIAKKYKALCFESSNPIGINSSNSNFNILHQLNHIYWHLTVEGVGLRQLLDLYFTIINHKGSFDFQEVKYLELEKFTSAAMWVLEYIFKMDHDFMLCEPNEKEGRFLLTEIMRAGNFGHHDNRIQRTSKDSKITIVFMWIKHVCRLIKHYPADVLWTPIGIAYLSIVGRLQSRLF